MGGAAVRIAWLALCSHASALSVSAPTSRASRVRVAHILVDSEGLAEQCMVMLADGQPFDVLAESVSTCDSKARGGDLGWITPGLMVPEFDEAAFTLPPGEVVSVQSEFGWHVVQVAEASYEASEMEPDELRERLGVDSDSPSFHLIDIRDEQERAQAMIPNAPARHLPYAQWQSWAEEAIEGTLVPPLPKEAEVVFMDHRGGRGERLMQYFAQNGFLRARFLRGGINAYAEEADPSVPVYLESDGDCLTCHEH